jgi:hypothetical protein
MNSQIIHHHRIFVPHYTKKSWKVVQSIEERKLMTGTGEVQARSQFASGMNGLYWSMALVQHFRS